MTTNDKRLIIFDTTLRDGEQSPGASMTKDEKLRIAKARAPQNGKALAELLAWLANPGDTQAIAVRAKLREWVPEYTGGA